MKRWLRIGGIVVGILLLIVIVLPFLINVNSFRPRVESEASAALGRQVSVGDLSLSILSGSVGAENISIADDPAFSKSPFVTAKSLKVGVELMPLIFSKQLNVTDISLEEPQITLLENRRRQVEFLQFGRGFLQARGETGCVRAAKFLGGEGQREPRKIVGGKSKLFREAGGLRQRQH